MKKRYSLAIVVTMVLFWQSFVHAMAPGFHVEANGYEITIGPMVFAFGSNVRSNDKDTVNRELGQAVGRAQALGQAYEYEVTHAPDGWHSVECQRIPLWRRGAFVAALAFATSVSTGYLIGTIMPQ